MKAHEDKIQKLAALSSSDLLAQTKRQYNVVNHLATALAIVHAQTLNIMEKQPREVVEFQCVRSAEIMNQIADILNEMGAVDRSEDKWTDEIFAKAAQLMG